MIEFLIIFNRGDDFEEQNEGWSTLMFNFRSLSWRLVVLYLSYKILNLFSSILRTCFTLKKVGSHWLFDWSLYYYGWDISLYFAVYSMRYHKYIIIILVVSDKIFCDFDIYN